MRLVPAMPHDVAANLRAELDEMCFGLPAGGAFAGPACRTPCTPADAGALCDDAGQRPRTCQRMEKAVSLYSRKYSIVRDVGEPLRRLLVESHPHMPTPFLLLDKCVSLVASAAPPTIPTEGAQPLSPDAHGKRRTDGDARPSRRVSPRFKGGGGA